ncbi:hypothetical protein HMPREF0650_1140 [Hoylesella buccalis ATCC 35310]|uniref:Uncharacterized protein n=1 Tax=Hoylesella buccalis ATCC 35310 TaxID=679190 RepID=D1W6D3_9BACT|nr:hypothetical protein HMPREF0650_1140 [Hoylesella buccalis ATCC 35310]
MLHPLQSSVEALAGAMKNVHLFVNATNKCYLCRQKQG